MLDFTHLLKGGLYQIMWRFLFLLALVGLSFGLAEFSLCGSYVSWCLKPLLSNAFWYSGLALSNSTSEHEMVESRESLVDREGNLFQDCWWVVGLLMDIEGRVIGFSKGGELF